MKKKIQLTRKQRIEHILAIICTYLCTCYYNTNTVYYYYNGGGYFGPFETWDVFLSIIL